MNVIEALSAPWAIKPEMLETMIDVYQRHARGEGFDRAAVEAAIGKPLDNKRLPYQVIDGVAVIPVDGVLSKRMNMFAEISGGTSMQMLQRDVATALNDPTAHSILLHVDSPGGEVEGTQVLGNDIFAARQQKPIVAFADGLMASAAYWLGSAANRVYIGSDTTQVGSIGVYTKHVDVSKAQEMRGVKVTDITAGKYKRIASENGPLTKEGFQSMKDGVDHMYRVMVDDIARNRGTSADTVLQNMADGRIFLGQKAIDAGLADGTSSIPEIIAMLNDMQQSGKGFGATAPGAQRMEKKYSAEELEAAKAEAFERGKTEGHTAGKTEGHTAGKTEGFAEGKAAGTAEGKAVGIVEGATQERERVKAVEAQTLPGHEALITELKFDGKTSGPEAAVRVLNAERDAKAKRASEQREDAPKGLPNSGREEGTAGEPDAKLIAAEAREYVAKQKEKGVEVNVEDAVRHVRKQRGLK